MSELCLFISLVCLVVLFVIQTGRAEHYRGMFEILTKQVEYEKTQGNGWEDEAKFWRNVFEAEAETKRIKENPN